MLLNQAKAIIVENSRRRRLTASGYNVFAVLDRLRDENKGHSAFIANLLDPKGSHSQEYVFLKMFLLELFPENEFHLKGDWDVQTEKYAPTETEVENSVHEGRIDIWIEGPKDIIIIENKIDAGDQKRQLERYINYAKGRPGNKTIYVIYLTPEGKIPSKDSLGCYYNTDLEREISGYLEASYEEHIYPWIDQCLKESVSLPVLRETLAQYKKTIREITGKIEEEELGMNLSNLLEKKEDIIAAVKLGKAADARLVELESAFWNEIKQIYNMVVDGKSIINDNDKKDGRYYGVGLKVAHDDKSDLYLRIERDSYNGKIYAGFRQTSKGNFSYHTKTMYSSILEKLVGPITKNWHSNNHWLGFEYLEGMPSFTPGEETFVGYLEGDDLKIFIERVRKRVYEITNKLTKCKIPNGARIITFK